jgi:hypothetical protein
MSEQAARTRLHSIAEELIHHHLLLDYPRDDVRGPADEATWKLSWTEAQDWLRRGRHLQFDCSQSVTQIFHWAKLKDPNGLAFKHPGYTGTMLHHLEHYTDPARARPGALVVFGPGDGEHVAMVLEHGRDPLLFSHGAAHSAGPIRLSVERTYHHAPVTFLAVDKLLTNP